MRHVQNQLTPVKPDDPSQCHFCKHLKCTLGACHLRDKGCSNGQAYQFNIPPPPKRDAGKGTVNILPNGKQLVRPKVLCAFSILLVTYCTDIRPTNVLAAGSLEKIGVKATITESCVNSNRNSHANRQYILDTMLNKSMFNIDASRLWPACLQRPLKTHPAKP